MIHLITGGERSGKSAYAQQLALAQSDRPVYLATAPPYPSDDSWTERITRHQQTRDALWKNLEEPLHLDRVIPAQSVVVIDCITLWLSNWLAEKAYDREAALRAAQQAFDRVMLVESELLIVTNEVGMGLHADTSVGRDFVELQGWINQYIAQRAERVTFMVAGLPLSIKEPDLSTH